MQEAPFSSRIFETFCADCKYRKKANAQGCPLFVSADAVCVRFEWCSKARKEEYENEVLDNQAVTLWLIRGKSLEEIYQMSKSELCSLLTKKHYSQFEEREKSDKEQLERRLAEKEVEKRFSKEPTLTTPRQMQKLNQRKEEAIQEELKKRKICASQGPEIIATDDLPKDTKKLVKEIKEQATEVCRATVVFLDDDTGKKNSTRIVSKSIMDAALDKMRGRFGKIEISHKEESELLDKIEPQVTKMVEDGVSVEPISAKRQKKITRIFPTLQLTNTPSKMHYFNCKKPDGKLVTYKRDPQAKNYQSEIVAFRKYLAKQNISILTEEIR